MTDPVSKPRPRLTVVVPCYNEQEVLPETMIRLSKLITGLIENEQIDEASQIVFVDDGSRDATWTLISEFAERNPGRVGGIKLSRNRGHQNALLAGLLSVSGEAIISVDADLQDDLNAIPEMLEAYAGGADIVYGVRASRKSDSYFKRITAEGYYHILSWLGASIEFNHADYRLMSRRALEALREYKEANMFLRGIIPQIGFVTRKVQFNREERYAGESKYPLSKMVSLAIEGVTSFTIMPLRIITVTGLLLALGAITLGVWALYMAIINSGGLVPGWASIMVPLLLLGGIQLVCLGIIGEYLGKVYIETKQRPRYHIDKIAGGVRQFRIVEPSQTGTDLRKKDSDKKAMCSRCGGSIESERL